MSYKKLGDLVRFISNKNTDERATVLYGINIDKFFMPSVANTIGVDLKKYKVVDNYQFACNRMHVGRDERLPIAMSTYDYPFIVSPAYDVFEVIDTNVVIPEYLMLWFRRGEFDRQCWFYTDADVRGGLHLDALKAIEIEVPSIEKQREIVAQYEAVANKIKVNEAICEKLEATAQALYKHWFVDFEFPNNEGQPYKSSGGAMVFNEELEKEIPEGWEVKEFQTITKVTSGKNLKGELGTKFPIYGAGGITGYSDEYLFNEKIIIIGRVGTHGKVFIEYGKSYPTDNTLVFTPENLYFSYFILKFLNYDELNKGGVQALLTQTDLKQMKVLLPNFDLKLFENYVEKPFILKNKIEIENQKLTQLQSLLLFRLARLEG